MNIKTKNMRIESKESNTRQNHLLRRLCEFALLLSILSAGVVHAKASDVTPENVLKQINYQRELRGIKPLQGDMRLDRAALNKSNDMIERDYFDHYAYGLTPWVFISKQNYNYLYAGENLAMDFQTSEGMVRAWMSSPAHRKNILNPDYDEIGIGIVKGEFTDDEGTRSTSMVTNMFGKEKPIILKLFDEVISRLKRLF